jgi:RNA polymerase sigma factor (sigma-70 family)
MTAPSGSSSDQPDLSEAGDCIPTRESLLSRLKDWDDQVSWKDFFDTYWRLIYNLARKAGLSDAEAQDIVQETVLSVARKIEGFRYDPAVCTFKSWMLQITRWRIANQKKKRQREERRLTNAVDSEEETAAIERIADPAGFDLESVWEEEWQKNLLTAALERVKRRVDPEQFQIFDLHCLQQWPVGKVTATLGVSAARVYLAKHRVGGVLKKELSRLERMSFAPKAG